MDSGKLIYELLNEILSYYYFLIYLIINFIWSFIQNYVLGAFLVDNYIHYLWCSDWIITFFFHINIVIQEKVLISLPDRYHSFIYVLPKYLEPKCSFSLNTGIFCLSDKTVWLYKDPDFSATKYYFFLLNRTKRDMLYEVIIIWI